MASGPVRYTRQFRLLPAELGLNGAVLSAERTSNSFSGVGYNQITIHTQLTYVAATAYQVYLDTSQDNTTWETATSVATSAGVGTTSAFYWEITAGSSINRSLNSPINARFMRIRVNSTGGTTDTLVVDVDLACQ